MPPRLALDIPLFNLANATVSLDEHAVPCCFRFLDCNAFIDSDMLRIIEWPDGSLPEYSFAAISYPWRDLQIPTGTTPPEGSFSVKGAERADHISIDVLRTACIAAHCFGRSILWMDRLCILQTRKDDKNWQIQRMFQIYAHCDPCLVFPGGLVRLAGLSEPTTWIDRAWTLQEASAPGQEAVALLDARSAYGPSRAGCSGPARQGPQLPVPPEPQESSQGAPRRAVEPALRQLVQPRPEPALLRPAPRRPWPARPSWLVPHVPPCAPWCAPWP